MNGFPPYPIDATYRRPLGWLRLGGRAARLALRSSSGRPARLLPAFSQAVQLLGREGFQSGEIRRLELLEPMRRDVPIPALSRRAMERIAEALNPAEARAKLRDKMLFQRVCEAQSLPAPRVVGLFRGDRTGWLTDDSRPAGPEAWRRFLERDGPDELVVKPVVGSYGRGVRVVFRVSEDGFRDATGAALDAAGLVESMTALGREHGCMVQERVRGHEELARLSGTTHLQTTRIYTLLDRDGEPHLLQAFFKLIAGRNFVDNFAWGTTGNFIALPSLADGVFGPGLAPNRRGNLRPIPCHPDTGARIEGFTVPDWQAIRDLALRAARAFAPLRLIGWDIAPTDSGPVLIEGNWNPDPPNFGGGMGRVLADLRRLA